MAYKFINLLYTITNKFAETTYLGKKRNKTITIKEISHCS